MNGYEDVKATGSLKLEGKVSGAVTETATPNVDAELLITNATFSYPDLPKKAENIQVDVDLHYDGVQMDNTTVDVNKFHIELGPNPIDMVMNLRTPISDPFTNGSLSMSLDLGSLKDVVPLDSMELTGLINAKLDWMGKLSSIENEKYEEFKADGNIQITNLYYNSSELSSFDAIIGKSDFALAGKVTNYIPFVLKDETIKGEMSLNSNLMDLNEFMTDEEAPATAETDTAPMQVVEVPGNIDFRLASTINKIYYDKLTIDNLKGLIIVKDKAVKMQNLSMELLDGSFVLSGEYNTMDIKNPFVNLDFEAKGIDIPKTTETFATVSKIAPVAKNASGKISLGMSFNSFLTQDMTPVMNSIAGKGKLSSEQIGLKKSASFSKIGEALKTDAFNNMVLKNINISFEIIKGSLYVEPFETKMGDATMLISGQQSFDNSLDYSINLGMPRKMLGLNNNAITSLYSSATSKGLNITPAENVNILAKVTGPISDPKVTLDLKDNAKQAAKAVKEEIKQAATQAIEAKKEDIKVQARAEADKIIKEAEKQAQLIREEGKNLANTTRSEANSNADNLVKEAKNPLAKAAAKATADKMKSEGEKKAQKIESESNGKADKVIQEARAKADNLLK
jgi:cell division septum initiation protein DivIVA